MRINHTAKGNAGPLSVCRLGEQVIILGKQDSSQARRPIEEIGVRDFMRLIFVGCENIYLPEG